MFLAALVFSGNSEGTPQECFGLRWKFVGNSALSGNAKPALTMLLECSSKTLEMLQAFKECSWLLWGPPEIPKELRVLLKLQLSALWKFRVNSMFSGKSKAVLTMLLACSSNTLEMLREFSRNAPRCFGDLWKFRAYSVFSGNSEEHPATGGAGVMRRNVLVFVGNSSVNLGSQKLPTQF